jgi:hypothetical protein
LKLQRELQEKEATEFANHVRHHSPLSENLSINYDGIKLSNKASRSEREVSPKIKKKPGIGIFSRLKRSSHSDFQPSFHGKSEVKSTKKNEGIQRPISRSISSPTLSSKDVVLEVECEERAGANIMF